MKIRNWIHGKRVERRVFAFLFCLVLLSMFTHTVVLAAEQPGAQSLATAGMNNPAHDITMAGTVRQLVAGHATGTSAGLQLVADGPQGLFTASVGSGLSREVQQSLSQGTTVQISGVMQTIDGKEYLLARTLTVDGKQIVVRNEKGFLVHQSQRTRASVNNSALYRSAK